MIETVLALLAVLDEIGLLELGEMGGDPALAEAEDFLEFGDGEFFAVKEQEDAEAVDVADGSQRFQDGCQLTLLSSVLIYQHIPIR